MSKRKRERERERGERASARHVEDEESGTNGIQQSS